MKLKLLALFALTSPLLFFFAWMLISSFFSPPPSKTPIPVSKNFDRDYSQLYKTVPGKSTLSEVIKTNGQPVSQKTSGNKKYLYYQTPSADYKNVVLLQNNVVVYALENIFGNYRGTIDAYKQKYGLPSFTAYENSVDFPWDIYLSRGLGVQSSAGLITAFLYFKPQDEKNFFSNIGNELGFSKTPTAIKNLPQDSGPTKNNQIKNYPIPGP